MTYGFDKLFGSVSDPDFVPTKAKVLKALKLAEEVLIEKDREFDRTRRDRRGLIDTILDYLTNPNQPVIQVFRSLSGDLGLGFRIRI